MDAIKRRITSFIVGGLCAAVVLVIGIVTCINNSSTNTIWLWLILALCAFAFPSCLILDNNFITDFFIGGLGWGFVKMPGLIFTLDLDGIIWLITVKLIFWIISFVIAVVVGIISFVISAILSVFVYPFAIYKNIKHPDEI